MRLTLKDCVRAYAAAAELSREKVPYALALALVQVKKQVREEAELFMELERKQLEALGGAAQAVNETGSYRLTFKSPEDAERYARERRELEETPVEPALRPLRATVPAAITAEQLEALENFIAFTEGGNQ